MASKTIRPTTITCPQRILVPDIPTILCAVDFGELKLEPEVALAAKTPFNASAVLHDAGDVLAESLFELARPGHELESEPVIDHSEASRGERQAPAIGASDVLAGGSLHVRQPGVGRDSCTHLVQFASAQCVQ